MIYREFGKTGWNVSAVSLGTWNLGGQWGPVSEQEAITLVHTAIDEGMNLLDTAESYGLVQGASEMRLGKALGPRRDKIFLVTKTGHWGFRSGQPVPRTTPDMIRLCGHACLGRMRTEWIDVMLCHEGGIDDPTIYIEGFEQLKKEGHVRVYGISTNSLDVLRRFHDLSGGRCDVVEVDWSLLHRDAETGVLPFCLEHGIAVLVRGPLAKGLLSGKYDKSTRFTDAVRSRWHERPESQKKLEGDLERVARLGQVVATGEEMVTAALRYTLTHECNPVTIPGATRPRQVKTNAEAGSRELTPDEREKLLAAIE